MEYDNMLNSNKANPLMVIEASFNNGHDAHTTPVVPKNKAIKTSGFNLFFKKNMDEKLMNNGFVAMANAPTPAVTFCIATT